MYYTQWKINNYHSEKTVILLTCWSTYDVWKRLKCWKGYCTWYKSNNFHQRVTCTNVWNSQNCYNQQRNSNHFAHLLINLWRLKTSQMHEKSEIQLINNSTVFNAIWNLLICNFSDSLSMYLMCWCHLPRSENLQDLCFAMQNQCFGIIWWGLKSSKPCYTQCEINVLVISAEV